MCFGVVKKFVIQPPQSAEVNLNLIFVFKVAFKPTRKIFFSTVELKRWSGMES